MAAALSSKVAVQPAFKAAARPVARRAPVVAVRAAAVAGEVPDMNKRNIMVRAACRQTQLGISLQPQRASEALRARAVLTDGAIPLPCHCRTCCCWALSVPPLWAWPAPTPCSSCPPGKPSGVQMWL